MKKSIRMSVNGAHVSAEVEPRLQLAEFLREHLSLTGTHLGCEHGVCGACTVELGGAPVRSCIAYAVGCDGAEVRTIEGFDADPVMAELREAFSAHHALQCGYCTAGMLVTARDIVLRLPDADEARIRKELAGNLCRCTGYVGIVRAIQAVLTQRGGSPSPSGGSSFALPRSGRPGSVDNTVESSVRPQPFDFGAGAHAQDKPRVAQSKDERPAQPPAAQDVRGAAKPQNTLHQSFTVDYPRDAVWAFFGRLPDVTACLPGASVVGSPADHHVETTLRVKVGPIVAEFKGQADAVREPASYSGLIHGSARDVRSSSATRGEIRYALLPERGGAATRVEVDIGFTLTGPLAQFSRSSLMQDIAQRMTAAFAQNLQAHLHAESAGSPGTTTSAPAAELDAGWLFLSVLWNRITAFFRRR